MTLLITIGRAALGKAPLVLSGVEDSNAIGVTGYTEPAQSPRVTYAPESPHENGSIPLAVSWQQTIVGFDVCTTQAATEAEMRALVRELREAVGQFTFPVTVQADDAPAETWACHAGSVTPIGGRTTVDLQNHDPEWSVVIPAQPFPAYA